MSASQPYDFVHSCGLGDAAGELAARSLVGLPGRLGWRYVDPVPPRDFPHSQPLIYEPPLPHLAGLSGRRRRKAEDAWQGERARSRSAWEPMCQAWREAKLEFEAAERNRFLAADLWFPLTVRGTVDRLDVVGGVTDGWRFLLATLGLPLLTPESSTLVMDLTGESVADGLSELARSVSPVQQVNVSAAAGRYDPLARLKPDELAEVLAEAVARVRADDDAEKRALDAEVLHDLASELGGPATLARLLAGIRVLQRTYDLNSQVLSYDEVAAVTRLIDQYGEDPTHVRGLRFLRSTLQLLLPSEDGQAPDDPVRDLWPTGTLTIVKSDHAHERSKTLADHLFFLSVLHDLRQPSFAPGRLLVVLGADDLGRRGLEDLAKQARNRRATLILFFRNYREAARDIVGGSESATLFMRLGPGEEAAKAAEFIGRGHSFVLSQITCTLGRTDQVGAGTATGTSEGTSYGEQSGTSRQGFQFSSNQGSNFSRTMGTSTQETTNWSRSDSFTHGTTEQRVYEFFVEPTELQSLPATAVMLVQGQDSEKRIEVGDCNIGIALAERVSLEPAPAGY